MIPITYVVVIICFAVALFSVGARPLCLGEDMMRLGTHVWSPECRLLSGVFFSRAVGVGLLEPPPNSLPATSSGHTSPSRPWQVMFDEMYIERLWTTQVNTVPSILLRSLSHCRAI